MKYLKLNFLLVVPVALLFNLGVSAQTSLADATERLKSSGYPILTMLSFSDTKLQYASTGLFKTYSDKNVRLFLAMLSPVANGADLAFKTFETCIPTDATKPLDQRFIWVHGQKLKSLYACVPDQSTSGTTEIFLLASRAGVAFAIKAFADNEYVVVQLDDLAIPFKTSGFARDLAQAGGKAL